MSQTPFNRNYPMLCQILAGSDFDADTEAAATLDYTAYRQALKDSRFHLNALMLLLCGAVVPEVSDTGASELERNLAHVVKTVGLETARRCYRAKLLVTEEGALDDVQYEIAVTSRACSVLDSGSIKLEKPIPNPAKDPKDWKNSDIYGTFQQSPVRIEVTVLHESLEHVDLPLDEIVQKAETSSGFSIRLRSIIADRGYAERVRALVELLHEKHVFTNGSDVEIDGVRFEWRGGAYHCGQESSPFVSICFYDEDQGYENTRDIIHPCSVRSLTPKHIREDNPNPPGIIDVFDTPDVSKKVPVSTKVRQMLAGKLQQCESGFINIVAFGNPLPMNDGDVVNAVCGVVMQMSDGSSQRDVKAPFVLADRLANDDDRREFVEPFRKLSAVWCLRLGSYDKSTIVSNPNALHPVPKALVQALSCPLDSPITAGL